MTPSLKLNLSTARADRHDSRADVLPLRLPGSPAPGNARVARFPFFARFAVINLVGLALWRGRIRRND
jgi:hypothetical protein